MPLMQPLPTPDEVMAVAFEEFALLLDAEQARAALYGGPEPLVREVPDTSP
jgi:hypothetical protein